MLIKDESRRLLVKNSVSILCLSQFFFLLLFRLTVSDMGYACYIVDMLVIPAVIVCSLIGYWRLKLYKKPVLLILHILSVYLTISSVLKMARPDGDP